MEALVRKVYPIRGEKTVSNRVTLDLIPFTANNRKSLNVKRESRDGMMSVVYQALTPITDFEAKTSLSVFKMCLDADAHRGENAVKKVKDMGKYVQVFVDIRDLTRFITGRTTKEQRKKVYNSLKKVRDMSVDITRKRTAPEGGGEMNIVTSWFYELKTDDDYETATVWISKTALEVASADGISWNLKFAVQNLSGRAFLLYLHMQSWKYQTSPGKYGYQHQVPHESIAQALDLGEIKGEKDQLKKARSAFRELNSLGVCNYRYEARFGLWVKQKVLK